MTDDDIQLAIDAAYHELMLATTDEKRILARDALFAAIDQKNQVCTVRYTERVH